MQPGKIDGATRALGAPPDWDAATQGECETLTIRDVVLMHTHAMQSAWYPSEEEKQAIVQGRPIILTVWSRTHPPVSIDVTL